MEDSSLRSMKGPSLSSWGTTLVDHHDGEEEEEEEETQESGWTAYLEDFSEHQRLLSNVDHHSSFCSGFSIGPSLISDAGSRYCDRANSVHGSPPDDSFDRLAVPKKLSLIKKMRAKKIAEEDPLEDTASSPASSPKVVLLYKLPFNRSEPFWTIKTGRIRTRLLASLIIEFWFKSHMKGRPWLIYRFISLPNSDDFFISTCHWFLLCDFIRWMIVKGWIWIPERQKTLNLISL